MSSSKPTLHTTHKGQKAQALWCALSGRMEAGLRQGTTKYFPVSTSAISFANPEVDT
jgi:hypothetical protein